MQIWELEFGKFPTIPWTEKRGSLSLNCVQTIWVMVHACFPPGSLEAGTCRREIVYMTGTQSASWVLSLRELSWQTSVWHVLSQLAAAGIQHVLWDSTRGELLKLEPGSFQTATCAFSLGWFCFVSFHSNQSKMWVWLYVESCVVHGSAASASAGNLIKCKCSNPLHRPAEIDSLEAQ